MRKKYSPELKPQVIQEVLETGNSAAVAKKHDLNQRTVWTWTYQEKNKDAKSLK